MKDKDPFIGIGLKFQHLSDIFKEKPCVDFFEVHAENCFGDIILHKLCQLRERYALTLHGLGLSLGTDEPLSLNHLQFLKSIIKELDPLFFSEHVSWSHINGIYTNDLLPIPYTEESLKILCKNIHKTQEFFGRSIIVENISAYFAFKENNFSEVQFLSEVCKKTGCGLILDINNVFVSSQNMEFNPYKYIASFPASFVKEIHLAGHTFRKINGKNLCIDDHGSPVSSQVWDLYKYALKKIGKRPALIEWDNNIPSLDLLTKEALKIRDIVENH